MPGSDALRPKLNMISGKDYAAYQSMKGVYQFNLFKLIIEQIPKDPYAPPHTGIYRIQLSRSDARLAQFQLTTKIQKIACADFLNRRFYDVCRQICGGVRGTGFSGIITINQPGQVILERNSVLIADQFIELRCFVGLPAEGRAINSRIAEVMLFNELPEIVEKTFLKEYFDFRTLQKHIEVMEDAEFLRNLLPSLGLTAFIANNSVLPRESGTSDKPLPVKDAIPFISPENLKRVVELPHAGKISGMGIPRGITLITGGGYHGKSTLLNALQSGIYNHIPGDGREYCVTESQAVKIRAYDGRSVVKTDISPFIKNLPFKMDTTSFSTENASGSTSQAANIIEALEAGASALLMDEDTCATNFMIRDARMQKLVEKADEPITTFIDKVRQLYSEKQISTILVLGGVGEYFDVSDIVIQMKNYQPIDVTRQARKIVEELPTIRECEDKTYPFELRNRIPMPESIDPHNRYGKFTIHTKDMRRLNFGKQIIDLTDLEQIVELSQTKAIGFALNYATRYMDKKRCLREVIDLVMNDLNQHGLDILSDRISGHFTRFRSLELAFTLNRLRHVEVTQQKTVH